MERSEPPRPEHIDKILNISLIIAAVMFALGVVLMTVACFWLM